jgi:hypothetical protein
MYFVREYLQPIKSSRRENTVTIIASHGNLLTSFDWIINHFIKENLPHDSFGQFPLPVGTGLLHAEALLYHTLGGEPVKFTENFLQWEIPKTINHAQLKKDFYYEWAAVHRCRVSDNKTMQDCT